MTPRRRDHEETRSPSARPVRTAQATPAWHPGGMTAREVASGVFRLGTKWANFHLVREGAELTLIDAGYPGYWKQVVAALAELGLHPAALSGVVVTHHHVDHAGTAENARLSGAARVFVGEGDAEVARGERPSHVPPGFYRQSWRPSMARYLAHTVAAGGARYRPVSEVEVISADGVLDLPGRPRVVTTAGHTAGHCSVILDERGVLLTGDAMVNFDYATGQTGLRLHRFNEDRPRALQSLERLETLDAELLLFGHGDPWPGSPSQAVELVRQHS
jgi:glyoxylase-like metal-dependent hydrolase (beta-lactamase superfamily II)